MIIKTCFRTPFRRVARGFSLVELMVALTIGIFMSMALAAIFISTKRTFTAQDELSQLQDNERLALTSLINTIQLAGYFPNPLTQTRATALPASAPLGAGQAIHGTSGSATTSDTLTARYSSSGADGLSDCFGKASGGPTAAQVLTNQYTVSSDNELVCSNDGGTTNSTLATGIKRFTALYGTDTAGTGSVNRYLTASEVETGAFWSKVKTVRLNIEFINPFAKSPGQPATVEWIQMISLMSLI
jgi:type IV pilus assembly protein PilW